MTESPPPPDGGYVPHAFPQPPPPPQYVGYPPPFPGQFPREGPAWTQTPPTSPLAIIALVLAILPLGFTWLIAIVLAIVVLAGNQKAAGRGIAVAALVVSFVWIALAGVGTTFLVHQVSRHNDARAVDARAIWVDMLRSGDCLANLPQGDLIDQVDVIPCTQPHRGEVFSVYALVAGETRPGGASIGWRKPAATSGSTSSSGSTSTTRRSRRS